MMLIVDKIESGYGEMQVLWKVSLEVLKGSITVVLGPNGAGKTTLLRAIMGIIPIWSGTIKLGEQDITKKKPHEKVQLGMTLVPEGRKLFPELTVEENLRLGAFTRIKSHDIEDTLELVYNIFPRLRERRKQKAGTLSGGEQQMLAIGRALMSKPKLLLLDEPSQGLAPKLALSIVDTLAKLRSEENISILLVEQNIAAALKHADKAYILEQGRIIFRGKPEEIMENEALRKAYLGL